MKKLCTILFLLVSLLIFCPNNSAEIIATEINDFDPTLYTEKIIFYENNKIYYIRYGFNRENMVGNISINFSNDSIPQLFSTTSFNKIIDKLQEFSLNLNDRKVIYSFALGVTSELTISVSSSMDTKIRVYNSRGDLLCEDDDGFYNPDDDYTNYNAYMNVRLGSGIFYVEVVGINQSSNYYKGVLTIYVR